MHVILCNCTGCVCAAFRLQCRKAVHRRRKMIQLVTHDSYGEFVDDLAEMHRLRYRVFKERLRWDVQVNGGMEINEFDALHPAYLLQWGSYGRLEGIVRLLPSAGPTLLVATLLSHLV